MDVITYTPIGVVRSPFTSLEGMPLQSVAAHGVRGSVEFEPAYRAGLQDLEGFSHVILLTHLHRMSGFSPQVMSFLDTQPHGVFATRSPKRPNPIGLSVVRLVAVDIEGGTLLIEDVDMLDGTPLLDLKPYVPTFDAHQTDRIGWFTGRLEQVYTTRADDRFK
jgi:tRNA (adenine37-N6)-methyltransferase